jgi:putative tryptophan/tyrosine transport system substrate-binding protein
VRRRVIVGMTGAAALGGALPVVAQQAARVYRIGVLSEVLPRDAIFTGMGPRLKGFGYEEGRNLVVDYKFADFRPELLPGLAAEVVADKPDLILALLNREAVVLKRTTSTIPIVMVYVSCPVETGLIASLARPGGNITGTTTTVPVTAGKMTQTLRDAVPRMSRATWMVEPDYPGMKEYVQEAAKACAAMRLGLSVLTVRSSQELEAALAAIARERPDGVVVSMTGVMISAEARIIEFMARVRTPALYTTPRPARVGGLISFSADFVSILDRNAWIVDKILKGARPRDIPVEEPSKFMLKINLKTARAMGFAFPRELLARADEVFE